MTARPSNVPRQELIALRRSLANAHDAKLVRIIAMLDDMAAGGVADPLLDQVRPRLAKLRPDRRLRFTRLLFAPLDPLIVPAPHWHPPLPTIPRTALEPLGRTVRAALGHAVEPIDAAIAGRTLRDAEAVRRAGALLWPQAAGILTAAPPPLGWVEAGLKPALYAPLAHAVGAVLARLNDLQELELDAANGIEPPTQAIEAILDGITAESPAVQPMMVALLLARLPQASLVVRRRTGNSDGTHAVLRQAELQATTALIESLETPGGTEAPVLGTELVEAAPEVRRIAALLGWLDSAAAPDRRDRMATLRRRLDTACRERFADGLASEFLMPLGNLSADRDHGQQATLETTARRLRALETAGRHLGGADIYDTLLSQAAVAVATVQPDGVISVAHKIRLVELLAGPEAALALLDSVAM